MATGDGCQVNVWIDPWLKDSPDFRPTTPIPINLQHLQVADLWLPGQHMWDENFL